jgi:signal transduction histidine kinase
MTQNAAPDDELRRALTEVARLRAENQRLAEELTKAQGTHRLGAKVDAAEAHAEQAQLDLALALSGIGLWRHDLRTGLLFQDERVQAMIGRSAGAHGVPVETVRSWIHADDLADVQAAFDATLAGGGPIDTHTRYRHSDGRWRTVLTRRMLVRDAQGAPSMILGVALDVSLQQQRSNEALRLAQRLESAAQAARVGLWSGAIDAPRPEWNDYMYVLLARDRTRPPMNLGEALREYTLPEERDRVANLALQWLRGPADGTLDVRMRVRRDDGELRWMQLRARRESDADGADRALGIMLDVTDEHEASERLRVANERTSLALSAVHMGTWSHDVASGRDDWDDQMFVLRGLTPGTAVPDRAQRMALVVPEDQSSADVSAKPFTSSATPLAYEFRIRRANDGAIRTLASRSVALTDADGRVTRRIGINWDVTEVRLAERLQRESELALRESRAKSALFGRISHELRTPLNAVLGFAQLMQSENEHSTAAERTHRLRQIQSAGNRLVALLDDVLDLGDPDANKLVCLPLSLADALDSATETLAEAALLRHVRIERTELSLRVIADEQRLQQVLVQLLGNAIKFSRLHGVVRIQARVVGRDVVLAIEDSGPGIDAERARRLFEPFAGPEGSAKAETQGFGLGIGIGIGLAIGQSLVQRMGGRIELARTGPQGSVFELWLPLWSPVEAPAAIAAPVHRAPVLLYIEDNDVNMLIMRELLAKRPRLAFHGAADGASGVRLARELLPSLVLIDMQLPDFNGVEVLRRLRADPQTAALRCVALSANALAEDMQSALAAGFDDYWTKPIDMAAFLGVIDRLLPTP